MDENVDVNKKNSSQNLDSNSQETQFSFSDSLPTSDKFSVSKVFSGFEAYTFMKKQPTIVTLIEALDVAFGGGIQTRCITEFCGPPATGKSQIAMQLCLSLQLPHTGYDGDAYAVYIDTEASFSPSRLFQMAQFLVSRLPESPSVEHFLSHIYIFRVFTYGKLLEIVRALPDFIKSKGNIRLIVIDSVSSPFREFFIKKNNRSYNAIVEFGELLKVISRTNNVAVVTTNQVTNRNPKATNYFQNNQNSYKYSNSYRPITFPYQTSMEININNNDNNNNVGNSSGSDISSSSSTSNDGWESEIVEVPSMGDSWTNQVMHRVMLKAISPQRTIQIIKTPNFSPKIIIPFLIDENGVRGFVKNEEKIKEKDEYDYKDNNSLEGKRKLEEEKKDEDKEEEKDDDNNNDGDVKVKEKDEVIKKKKKENGDGVEVEKERDSFDNINFDDFDMGEISHEQQSTTPLIIEKNKTVTDDSTSLPSSPQLSSLPFPNIQFESGSSKNNNYKRVRNEDN